MVSNCGFVGGFVCRKEDNMGIINESVQLVVGLCLHAKCLWRRRY